MTESEIDEFCSTLEYRICDILQSSCHEDLKGYWCDGVTIGSSDDFHLSQKYINDHRTIEAKSWIGKDDIDEFRMVIHFGKKSLSRYARSLGIVECIPSTENSDWFDIDLPAQTVEVRLK